MPNPRKKVPILELDLTPSSLHLLKRAHLQQHCKRLGLSAGGKNTDLLQRLQDYLKQTSKGGQSPKTPPPGTPEDRSTPEAQTGGRGWCVIHGLQLTVDRWTQLTLRCGRVCVAIGNSYVPLHLTPSSLPTPPGLMDNLVCKECLERNQEKESRIQQKSTAQDKSYPPSGQMRKSMVSNNSRSCNKSSRFQPQEDPEYARKVDELLLKMASGQVDSDKVLGSMCPTVVHSPLGKQECS
ncbi:uncharacterized protein LOC128641630 [Bombina bombina]|uniref:uncharacterized protein LOC128641630 n=1 Tax=Bombina bombina TaxID=8345 RepID=UPI00235ABFFD|nr:uncharacterized protein LOC128641630 [Bombina bombina]